MKFQRLLLQHNFRYELKSKFNIQLRLNSSKTFVQGEWRSALKQIRREVKEQQTTELRKESLQNSQKVVALAMFSNGVMFTGKLVAAIQSGSASMFSESLHSLADIINEGLLMWGIRRSLREADSTHPYGYMQERYAWALVSGVGIFFLGGGVSLYHGISGLFTTHELGSLNLAAMALGGSLVFEAITITYAYNHISKSAKSANSSFFEYLKKGADPSAVQIFLEDCASITGIAIASICLSLSHFLSLSVFDHVGSIAIGCLLSGVATFLIRRNIAGLVETSMPEDKQQEIISILQTDPVVLSVHDVKSTHKGPEWVRFKAEILFDGEEIVKRYIERNPESFENETEQDKQWLIQHGTKVISLLGVEVDRIERRVTDKRPEVKHIDLEIL